MKIAVTGHTSGIGKGLYEFYKKANHEVLGFSRSNGYDIEKKSDEIVEQAKDFDIFFNNAYCGFSQVKLLFQFWKEWHNKDKLIININSAICRISYPYTYHPLVSKYKVHKLSLDRAVKELQQTPSKCQVSQVIFSCVDTNFFLHEGETFKKVFGNKKTLSVKNAVEMTNIIITNKKKFKINDMVVGDI